MPETIARQPLTELGIVQNSALAAELIFSAAVGCKEVSKGERALPFAASVLILPVCFHRNSAAALAPMWKTGVLEKILGSHSQLRAGLQERVVALGRTTLEALDLCFSSGVLGLKRSSYELVPLRATTIKQHYDGDTRQALKAAARMGAVFAENDVSRVFRLLGVTL